MSRQQKNVPPGSHCSSDQIRTTLRAAEARASRSSPFGLVALQTERSADPTRSLNMEGRQERAVTAIELLSRRPRPRCAEPAPQ